MRNRPELQFVWPKDGPEGKSGRRGFWGRLDDIRTGKGPDVFLQKQGSIKPIGVEQWGNWDSYHFQPADWHEKRGLKSRGTKRYDPHSRRYKEWSIPYDWNGEYHELHPFGPPDYARYPRFTLNENRKMRRFLNRGSQIDPLIMGKDWTTQGPKRFRNEHDWFWQEAHRIGENRREGFKLWDTPNRNLNMDLPWPQDLRHWIRDEALWGRL